jgi:hypothetical protein
MHCPVLVNANCFARALTGSVTAEVIAGVAHAVHSGVAWMVASTVDWWVQIPSPDLAADPIVGALQAWFLPITITVAVGAMLVAAGKMALIRKANPLIDVGIGVAVIAATSALGVLVPTMLLKAGDAWSSWVLTASTGGRFGAQLTVVLTLQAAQPVVAIVLGVIAIILSVIQAVIMLFRQASLVILAGVLPLASAGMLAPRTRAWFRRVTGWMLALIFYKPAAAAVYATAFTMIGRGRDPRTILMGYVMVLLSLLALPVLMKFFTWTTGSVETSAGGGFLSTVLSGAVAVGAVRGSLTGAGAVAASDQARLVETQLGPPGGSGQTRSGGPQGTPGPQNASGPAGAPAGSGTGSADTNSAGPAGTWNATSGTGAAALAEGAARVGRGIDEAIQPPETQD